ncbi:MAG: hypothetical protein ABIN48_00590 [Ginsengibacter sp.]
MKKLIALVFLCITVSSKAQLRLPGKSGAKQSEKSATPSIKTDIEKVARDLYQGFNNIKGDTLMQATNTIKFASKVIPVGATDCYVIKHPYPNSYSWQAVMFESEEFSEAVAKYRTFYRQLTGTTITFYDKSSYKLTGEYDTPDEGRAFASSMLHLHGARESMKSLKIDIGLNYSFPQWQVTILVYEKVPDEDIRPTGNGHLY